MCHCVQRLFEGELPGYQACDTLYHDLEHTMECSLAMSRILSGMYKANGNCLTPQLAEWGLVASLLHDTGYIKTEGDYTGTGAKYTKTHILRGAHFIARHMRAYGYTDRAVAAIQNMIWCTGFDVDLRKVLFQDQHERVLGCCLGTADLLGQMASPRYVEKLPILFFELAEGGIQDFRDPEDLMRKTPNFFHSAVMNRCNEDLEGTYRFLDHCFPDGQNHYLMAIERNLAALDHMVAAQGSFQIP